jgi:hypothetical protein
MNKFIGSAVIVLSMLTSFSALAQTTQKKAAPCSCLISPHLRMEAPVVGASVCQFFPALTSGEKTELGALRAKKSFIFFLSTPDAERLAALEKREGQSALHFPFLPRLNLADSFRPSKARNAEMMVIERPFFLPGFDKLYARSRKNHMSLGEIKNFDRMQAISLLKFVHMKVTPESIRRMEKATNFTANFTAKAL